MGTARSAHGGENHQQWYVYMENTGIKLQYSMRHSSFRYSQGLVHGNTVVSHFGDVDRKCTFCNITERKREELRLGRELTDEEWVIIKENVPDEDRPHIYWGCPTAKELYK